MARKVKTALILLLGVVIGGIPALLFMGHQLRTFMASYAGTVLIEAATDARQISSGQGDDVLQRKRDAIPGMVLQLEAQHAAYLSERSRLDALWAVQRYYDANPFPAAPPEIKTVLDELPPRPKTCCEIKQNTDSESGDR